MIFGIVLLDVFYINLGWSWKWLLWKTSVFNSANILKNNYQKLQFWIVFKGYSTFFTLSSL